MNPAPASGTAAAMVNAPTFSVGKNMDHPHLKGRFTLRIWLPIEQIPILMGKGREVIHGIKRKTHVKSIECPVVEPGNLWAPVVIVGDPTSSFKAYQAIHSIVDEVDTTAVAEFPLHIRRHAIVIGPRGSTLKRISAENAVRIFVPDSRQGRGWGGPGEGGGGGGGDDSSFTNPDKNNIQLEGDVEPIFSALAMVIEAVYGFRATTLVGTFPPQAAAPLPGNANHLNSNVSINNLSRSDPASAAAVRATDVPAAVPLSSSASSSSGAFPAQPPPSPSPNVSGAAKRAPQAPAREGSGGSSASTGRRDLPTTAAASTVATASTSTVVASSGVLRVFPPSSSAATARGLPFSTVGGVKAQGKSPADTNSNGQQKQQQQQKHQRWPNPVEPSMPRLGANATVVPAPSPAAAPGAPTDGWGGTGEYHPSPRAAMIAARKPPSAAPLASKKEEEKEKKEASSGRGRSCGDPVDDAAAASSKPAIGGTAAAPERTLTEGKTSLENRPPAQTKQQKQQEVSVPPRRGQGQGHAMVEPIPGPLPSAEQSEETLQLPTRVVSVLQGHHHGKYRAVTVGSLKDAAKWSILKDIQKHTGTKLAAVSLSTPSQNSSAEPNSSAIASPATDKASSAGQAEKQKEPTSSKDRGSQKDGTEPLLELSMKGPTNCVEVAVEALRRLGRGDTVRDALNLVKKTSPHRRLNHQRRQQEQEQKEKEDRSRSKRENDGGDSGGGERKALGISGPNQAQPSTGNSAVTAAAPVSSRKPVKEASARSGDGGVLGGWKASNGGDGNSNRGTNSVGQGQSGGDKKHVDEALSARGSDGGKRNLKTEEARGGGGGPRGRPAGPGGSGEGTGGSGKKGRVGGENDKSVAGDPKGSQYRQPQLEASRPSQAVNEQGGPKQGPATKRPSSNRPPRNRRAGVPRGSRAGSAGRGGRGRGESGGGRGGGGTASGGAGGSGSETA